MPVEPTVPVPVPDPQVMIGGPTRGLVPALRPIRTDIQIHPALFVSCEWLPLEDRAELDPDGFESVLAVVCPKGVEPIDLQDDLTSDNFWSEFLVGATMAEEKRIKELLETRNPSKAEYEVLSENLYKLKNLAGDDYQTMVSKLMESMVVISHSSP